MYFKFIRNDYFIIFGANDVISAICVFFWHKYKHFWRDFIQMISEMELATSEKKNINI